MEHFDVLIVGAGLSGIGAAAHLKMECAGKEFCDFGRASGVGRDLGFVSLSGRSFGFGYVHARLQVSPVERSESDCRWSRDS